MKQLLFCILLISVLACQEQVSNDLLRPNWSTGDWRYYKRNMSTVVISNNDTIISSTCSKTWKFTISESATKYFNILTENLDTFNIEFYSFKDSVNILEDQAFYAMSGIYDNMDIPFEIQLDKNGKFIGVVDLEELYPLVMVSGLLKIDSISLSDNEIESYYELFSEADLLELLKFQIKLYEEISELFKIYNLENPSKTIVWVDSNFSHPGTGELLNAKISYMLESETDIHKIIRKDINVLPGIVQLFESDSTTNSNDVPSQLQSTGVYYLNKETSWVDSLYQQVNWELDGALIIFESFEQTFQ